MKSTRGSLETTHKQLEHMLRHGDDTGNNCVGDSGMVGEKRERT
jgi:hypothetical protein